MSLTHSRAPYGTIQIVLGATTVLFTVLGLLAFQSHSFRGHVEGKVTTVTTTSVPTTGSGTAPTTSSLPEATTLPTPSTTVAEALGASSKTVSGTVIVVDQGNGVEGWLGAGGAVVSALAAIFAGRRRRQSSD